MWAQRAESQEDKDDREVRGMEPVMVSSYIERRED